MCVFQKPEPGHEFGGPDLQGIFLWGHSCKFQLALPKKATLVAHGTGQWRLSSRGFTKEWASCLWIATMTKLHAAGSTCRAPDDCEFAWEYGFFLSFLPQRPTQQKHSFVRNIPAGLCAPAPTYMVDALRRSQDSLAEVGAKTVFSLLGTIKVREDEG